MENNRINCFTSYCHEDKKFIKLFHTFAKDAERRFNLNLWTDAEIGAGENFDKEIAKKLKEADVIFLLISPDYIASTYCYDKELQFAIKKHKQGKCIFSHYYFVPLLLSKDIPFLNCAFSQLMHNL